MSEFEAVNAAVKWAGTQAYLAELLGTTQATVSAWICRYKRMGSGYALKMHQLTNGVVSAHDLRPDLYPRSVVSIRKTGLDK